MTRACIVEADAETFNINVDFDLCLSSATFSHFYPNFEAVAANIRRHLIIGGLLCFDVSEGDSAGGFQDDGKTYGRVYSEVEVREVFSPGRSNFDLLDIARIHQGLDGVTGNPVQMLFIAAKRAR